MRTIACAIVLSAAVASALPGIAAARAPTNADRWGCVFEAGLMYEQLDPADRPAWGGVVDIDCGARQTLVVLMTMLQDVPGAPDLLVNRDTWVLRAGPGAVHDGLSAMLPGGWCKPGGPPRYPFYFRARIQRKSEPGSVWLATPDGADPCPDGTWTRRY